MKKLSVIVLLMVMTFGISLAQGDLRANNSTRTPEERAEITTQRMTKMLSLTDDQTGKLKSVHLAQAKKMEALREKQSEDRQAFRSEWKAVQDETEAAYKEILTPGQYDQYLKAKEERMSKSRKYRDKSYKKGK